MASKRYGTLYTGVTSDLLQRVHQHKEGLLDGFSKKYNVKALVYHEKHEAADAAIQREKQIKDWKRQWKVDLIEKANPNWHDLFEELRNRARF
jgi:putative endonuclease